MICFVGGWISFLDSLFFPGRLFSVDGINKCGWCLVTQGPALDPKCKLIISLFLTLPHLLDCLICIRNAMSIVLLLQMMQGWDRGKRGGLIYIRAWVCFFLCFCILLSHVLSPFI